MAGEPRRWRRAWRLSSASLALAAVTVAAAVAGCGSSSAATSSTTKTSSAPSPRLTKAQYEQKLGPLLNDVVDPALRAALGKGGAARPEKLAAAITIIRLAHDQMAMITPPAEVADLHRQAVALMSSMIGDMTKLRDAETSSDKSGASSAVGALKTDAQHLENLGGQFSARGY